MSVLADKHAAVIGIDAYGNGLAALRTAAGDARAVAAALREVHGYRDPIELVDEEATAEGILRLLQADLPAAVRPDAALVVYFAGHGIALDGDDGPRGYLIPQDARSGQPETWLPMDRFRKALAGLPCRHLLVILDCCFAGSFRWASTRKTLLPALEPLYDSQYARFLEGTAWQVLTSASHEEEAQDVVPGRRNTRDLDGAEEHSPFAAALLAGLAGASDFSRGGHDADGVITATELHQYVFEELVPAGSRRRQTPGLWPLKPDNTGEFIFLSPRRVKWTRPDPPLEREVRDGGAPLIRVVGASGTGKSSVVKAGLLPRLRRPPAQTGGEVDEWSVVECERLGGLPREQLARAEERLDEQPADRRWLLVIDQFEELFTESRDRSEQHRFLDRLAALLTVAGDRLRVMITLRSDFEPQLTKTVLDPWIRRPSGRYQVPRFSSEELREIIEGPARVRAMFFEPPELVDRLVDEVVAMPGGLPLPRARSAFLAGPGGPPRDRRRRAPRRRLRVAAPRPGPRTATAGVPGPPRGLRKTAPRWRRRRARAPPGRHPQGSDRRPDRRRGPAQPRAPAPRQNEPPSETEPTVDVGPATEGVEAHGAAAAAFQRQAQPGCAAQLPGFLMVSHVLA